MGVKTERKLPFKKGSQEKYQKDIRQPNAIEEDFEEKTKEDDEAFDLDAEDGDDDVTGYF